jgi:ATP-dependent Clp protease ATP-binding subunit ClpA
VLSSELEICLNEAFQSAREARHEFMTVEHLLLAIVDTPKVREILRACGADVVRLRKDLKDFIDQTTPRLKDDDDREVQPTLGFQRVLQRYSTFNQAARKRSPQLTCSWRSSVRSTRMRHTCSPCKTWRGSMS